MHIGIIPDIHCKCRVVNNILDWLSPQVDEIVMLGDYVDDFNDDTAVMRQTILNIASWQDYSDKPLYMLLGNHEASYMNREARCSGHTKQKQSIWDAAVRDNIFDPKKFLSHKLYGNLLITHAGLNFRQDFYQQIELFNNFIANPTQWDSFLMGYHICDGGMGLGSIITSRSKYIKPSKQFCQIFGHTRQPRTGPEINIHENNNFYINLDTDLQHIMIVNTNDMFNHNIIKIDKLGFQYDH